LTSVGPYRIERELGRGGMGVVYLAHDPRLGRAVAIKALPDHLAGDPDRLARFEREARTLASLSHPGIAGIYGLEEADGKRYLVLEYVDGETLDTRLARGPLPLDDAVVVASKVAEALDAAATRLDSLSTGSEADGFPESPVVPSSSARCPPELLPKTPMRLGSTPYSFAC
jgi:serine/threonine protein kinase